MSRRASLFVCLAAAVPVSIAALAQSATTRPASAQSRVVEEAAIAVKQPGPHDGGGTTTAFPFFSDAPEFKMAFRKRILHRGSSIGYHRQEFDEVYYILDGTGEYTLNGVTRQVGPGTAMLTRPGDSHGLRPAGNGELALLIAYVNPQRP